MRIGVGQVDARVFCAALDIATPITGRYAVLMEQEITCWKWFLYVGRVITKSMMVTH
jgi:hypothetical protein